MWPLIVANENPNFGPQFGHIKANSTNVLATISKPEIQCLHTNLVCKKNQSFANTLKFAQMVALREYLNKPLIIVNFEGIPLVPCQN
jgi:hypothetical protein